MRDTYVPHDEQTLDDLPSQTFKKGTVGAWLFALISDVAAIVFTASLLWLGSGGVSVFAGKPLVMAVAFAGGAALAGTALISITRLSAVPGGEALRAGTTILLLAGAYVLLEFFVVDYFLAWMLLFAGAFFAARETVLIVAAAFRGQGAAALVWRAASAASGVAVILLLRRIWQDNSLLADLVVFVLLMAIAAMVLQALSGAVRASSHEERGSVDGPSLAPDERGELTGARQELRARLGGNRDDEGQHRVRHAAGGDQDRAGGENTARERGVRG